VVQLPMVTLLRQSRLSQDVGTNCRGLNVTKMLDLTKVSSENSN